MTAIFHFPIRSLSAAGAALALLVTPLAGMAADHEGHHGHADWGYDGKLGPKHWAELSPAYKLCRDGRRQSPIDLRTDQAFPARGVPFKVSYRPDTIDETNNGHTVTEVIHNDSGVTYDGRDYSLKQFHFHSHSEHTVNGKPRPLEIHLVHQDKEGRLLVIGVFFTVGKANETLEPLLRHLPAKAGQHQVDIKDKIDIRGLIPADSAIFTYDGSLTTPPATEGVRWFVYQTPLTVSAEQLKKFKQLYNHNFRPVQPLNGRFVGLFHTATPKKN